MAPIPEGNASEDETFHNFASTTVHHLNEPVRMISVYVDLLESSIGDQLKGEALQSVESLRNAVIQMQRLQHGLAEFASVTGKPSRPHSPVRLELPLRHALLKLDGELKSANGRVIYRDLPTVPGDFDRFQLLFEHLLHNAMRYSGGRMPEINVTARQTEKEWLIEVQDNGPGVEPEFRRKIFELYTRLHGKSLPGNGLGLPICRAIVSSHGGEIWVESGPGGGSSFCFTIPIYKAIE